MNDRLLDAAIETYPLEPLPDGFIARTMVQVRAEPRTAPVASPTVSPAPFRLEFIDLALPAFAAVFALMTLVVVATMWLTVDPLTRAYAELHLRQILLTQSAGWTAAAGRAILLVALAAVVTLAAGAGLWLDRTRLAMERSLAVRCR